MNSRGHLPVHLRLSRSGGYTPKQIRITVRIIAGLLLLSACGPAPQSPPKVPSVPTPAPGPSREPAQPPGPRTPTNDTLQTAQGSGLRAWLV